MKCCEYNPVPNQHIYMRRGWKSLTRVKRSSLFCPFIKDKQKGFIKLSTDLHANLLHLQLKKQSNFYIFFTTSQICFSYSIYSTVFGGYTILQEYKKCFQV
jgi:hypothetical protein